MYYKPANVMGMAENKDMDNKMNIMPNPMDANPVSPINIHNIPGPIMPEVKPDKKK